MITRLSVGCTQAVGPYPHPVRIPEITTAALHSVSLLSRTDVEALFCSVERAGYKIGERARWILRKYCGRYPWTEGSAESAFVSLSELGLPEGGYGDEVYAQASAANLYRHQFIVGPSLAASRYRPPKGQGLIIGTELLCGPDGEKFLLELANGFDGPILDATHGPPDGFWGPERMFAFSTWPPA